MHALDGIIDGERGAVPLRERHRASTAVRRAEHVRTHRTYRLRQRHVLRPRTSGVMHLR